ncbi:MAG: alpha/beta hydrolase [Pseudomonadota bacterium]
MSAPNSGTATSVLRLGVAILSLAAIAVSVFALWRAGEGVVVVTEMVGETPVKVYRPATPSADVGARPPVVVIAHGFAGSKRLMAPFATAIARNGYMAVTFEFLGHGAHPQPLTGNLLAVEGATQALLEQTKDVAAFAEGLDGAGEGRALLGHSMASDIIVRAAGDLDGVDATIAVSMFSPAVTAETPRNLLVIVGAWERSLVEEALRVTSLSIAPDTAAAEVTYGAFDGGTARRVTLSPSTEHIAVLYSPHSLREAVAWLDNTFAVERSGAVEAHARLPWIGLLVLGIVALAYPLSRLLPVVAEPPVGGGQSWRRVWPILVVPAVATPLLLRVLPTDFMPILVGDYLAAHFFTYGALTALLSAVLTPRQASSRVGVAPLFVSTVAVTGYALIALGLTIGLTITWFQPIPARAPLLALLFIGTLAYFLTEDWVTRGPQSARLSGLAARALFLLSLAAAVALDLERLFFLIILVPVIVLFFVIFALFGRWSYRRTGHPLPGAFAAATVFAWAIGVTFPMLAG